MSAHQRGIQLKSIGKSHDSNPEVQDSLVFFLPRDAIKRGLCCRLVSVRPSVTLVYCIHKAEDIVKLLSRSDSPITSF